jgi:hypothetical protein
MNEIRYITIMHNRYNAERTPAAVRTHDVFNTTVARLELVTVTRNPLCSVENGFRVTTVVILSIVVYVYLNLQLSESSEPCFEKVSLCRISVGPVQWRSLCLSNFGAWL